MLFATDKVWHYWIAVPLAVGAIALVLSMIGLYVTKVVRTRYPESHS